MPAQLLLTPSLGDALADAVRRGVPIETATTAAGISSKQYHDWLSGAERGTWSDGSPISEASMVKLRAFAQQIARARADHFNQMVASIQQCATTPNEKTGLPDWRAADAMLSKHPSYRKLWREERQVNVTQQGTVVHELKLAQALEPEALEAAYEALEALPEG